MYSLQDLVDLANDVLLPELTRIHASFALHIKTDCQVPDFLVADSSDEYNMFDFDTRYWCQFLEHLSWL